MLNDLAISFHGLPLSVQFLIISVGIVFQLWVAGRHWKIMLMFLMI
jgi:hypothetical protein